MKKILFVLSILTLMSYGCNRDESVETDSTRGMQQEETRTQDIPATDSEMDTQNMESRDMDSVDMDTQNMDEANEAMPSTSPSSDLETEDRQ